MSEMREQAEVPTTEIRVADAESLAEGEAAAFHWDGDSRGGGGFVLRHDSGWLAFRNRCPHWGVDLDMEMGGFYDRNIDRVFCRTHGALFQLPSGECDRGPCRGESLIAFPLRREGDAIYVTVPVEPPRDETFGF